VLDWVLPAAISLSTPVTDPRPSPPREPAPIIPIDRWITLTLLAVIVVGCYFVLQPFLSAIIWSFILCLATWPVYTRVRILVRGRAALAALLMTLGIAAVLLAPFIVVGVSLADNARELIEASRRLIAEGPPDPPAWVARVPLLGPRLDAYWAGLAHDSASVLAELKNYVEPIKTFALASGEALVHGILQLTLSIIIAFFVYCDGEAMTRRLLATVVRIFGERGRRLLNVAGGTTRGVVYGILGTALLQGILAAVGFALAGVPAAPLLGLATFFLSPVPIGPPLVWLPAAFWLFNHGATGWAIFMLVWGVAVVSSVDNVIKPLIISRGSNLPFILVMLGVLGGVVAFGFIGVFLGPTLLAIGFAMLSDWSTEPDQRPDVTR
jgi:predicted PurR-regulated permease PerM